MTDAKVIKVQQFDEFTIALMEEEDGEVFVRIRAPYHNESMEHIGLDTWKDALVMVAEGLKEADWISDGHGGRIDTKARDIDEVELVEVSIMKDGSLDPAVRVNVQVPMKKGYESPERMNPVDVRDALSNDPNHVPPEPELKACCGLDGCRCQPSTMEGFFPAADAEPVWDAGFESAQGPPESAGYLPTFVVPCQCGPEIDGVHEGQCNRGEYPEDMSAY